jgi:signal transduction histidine kinase
VRIRVKLVGLSVVSLCIFLISAFAIHKYSDYFYEILIMSLSVFSILYYLFIRFALSALTILKLAIQRITMEGLGSPIDEKVLQLSGHEAQLASAFVAMIYKLRTTMVLQDDLLSEFDAQQKANDERHELSERLKQINLEIEQISKIISHDFNIPLLEVHDLIQVLEVHALNASPAYAQSLKQLKHKVDHLVLLTQGIVKFSQASAVHVTTELINVEDLVKDVIKQLLPPPGIKVIIDKPLPQLIASKYSMEQIFINLLENAIIYNDKSQGHINIGCKELTNYYQFYVMDDGPGIDVLLQVGIFGLFQGSHSPEQGSHAVVGLAIVKKIVENHGGKIWLVSAAGAGATFYFTWPKSLPAIHK